jgi:hypothetical protein
LANPFGLVGCWIKIWHWGAPLRSIVQKRSGKVP